MAKFDILTAAGSAYKESWDARRYLLRLAAVPFALKLFCFAFATMYARPTGLEEGNYILFMLFMIPALVAEGWMLSHYVRFLILRQTWPFRPTGDFDTDIALLSERARGILGGMIVFVLINMGIGFLNDVISRTMLPYIPVEVGAPSAEIPAPLAFASILILVMMFWGFRLLWLHVPLALNMGFKTYLAGVKGASTSLHMIGVWLLCFVPFIVVLKILSVVVAAPVTLTLGEGAGTFVMAILSVLADTLKSIVTTAGIAFGLREIFTAKKA